MCVIHLVIRKAEMRRSFFPPFSDVLGVNLSYQCQFQLYFTPQRRFRYGDISLTGLIIEWVFEVDRFLGILSGFSGR